MCGREAFTGEIIIPYNNKFLRLNNVLNNKYVKYGPGPAPLH